MYMRRKPFITAGLYLNRRRLHRLVLGALAFGLVCAVPGSAALEPGVYRWEATVRQGGQTEDVEQDLVAVIDGAKLTLWAEDGIPVFGTIDANRFAGRMPMPGGQGVMVLDGTVVDAETITGTFESLGAGGQGPTGEFSLRRREGDVNHDAALQKAAAAISKNSAVYAALAEETEQAAARPGAGAGRSNAPEENRDPEERFAPQSPISSTWTFVQALIAGDIETAAECYVSRETYLSTFPRGGAAAYAAGRQRFEATLKALLAQHPEIRDMDPERLEHDRIQPPFENVTLYPRGCAGFRKTCVMYGPFRVLLRKDDQFYQLRVPGLVADADRWALFRPVGMLQEFREPQP